MSVAVLRRGLLDGWRGLAIAVAEMAIKSGKGAELDAGDGLPHAVLFGEDQARYVVAATAEMAKLVALNAVGAGVPFRVLGTVGGDSLKIGTVVDVSVADLTDAFEGWFPGFMSGEPVSDN